jgi:hypothetical protein
MLATLCDDVHLEDERNLPASSAKMSASTANPMRFSVRARNALFIKGTVVAW